MGRAVLQRRNRRRRTGKFDLLGLKTLTIIQTALELINERRAKEGLLPVGDKELYGFDDAKVFSIYVKGDTDNVFQSESDGFKSMLRDIHCDCLEDLIAAVSLYRPGPMSFIPTLAKRKAGLEPIEYDMPEFEPILKETYGIIVYQEQVMQIASAAAGFSLGQADILRRAMGKKKPEEMTLMRAGFIEGAGKKGISAEKAGEIFDKIESFAGYGFNKSHAAAYAVLSYQTAWLKVHYPTEFMAAVLTVDSENIDTVIKDIAAAINMGLTILPPCVNSSYSTFSAEGAAVRFGLSAVRGAGKGAMDAIIEERERGGKFKDLFEFCERVDLRKVNKGALEALIKAERSIFRALLAGRWLRFWKRRLTPARTNRRTLKPA
jgi:DNA polymerase-3 subunit alpha